MTQKIINWQRRYTIVKYLAYTMAAGSLVSLSYILKAIAIHLETCH
jgi:hypothetical protein